MIKTLIENTDPLPSSDTIISKLLTEETKLKSSLDPPFASEPFERAFVTQDKSNLKCHYCHETGHFIADCGKRKASEARKAATSDFKYHSFLAASKINTKFRRASLGNDDVTTVVPF